MQASRTPVHILTGFLGSGKTTLLNQLLSQHAFQNTAVVVNELGEIGLDHLLVSERADDIALLEGGCLCCAVTDSLPETLLDLCQKRAAGNLPPFDRIVIETTGFADPGPITEVIRHSPLLSHFLTSGLTITTIDMVSAPATTAQYPEARSQILLADRLIQTKLDLVEGAPDTSWIHTLNPIAELLTAQQIHDNPSLLLAPAPVQPRDLHICDHDCAAHGHTHHTHSVRAHSIALDQPVTHAGLAAFSAALRHKIGSKLLRCKGLVLLNNRSVLVQGVGPRFTYSDAPPSAAGNPYHLTCIVDGYDRADIAALFHWLYVSEGTMPPTPEELA